MPELRILWTTLPRAATSDHLDLDVLVSPRLGVDAPPTTSYTLADFPVFANWPAQLDDHLIFEVELDSGPPIAATRVPLDSTESDVDLDEVTWQRLFPATTPVQPWTRRSPAGRPLFSFPADAVAGYLHRTYKDAGHASALEPTGGDDLDGLVDDAGDLIDTRIDVERGEPTSHTTGGETTGGGPAPTTSQPGCVRGCLMAPLAWFAWLRKWLWHRLTGQPPPAPILVITGPAPPPVSVTPKVVTYEFPPRGPAPIPPALAAVEQHVAATGVSPPGGWVPPGSSLTPDQVALAAAWRFYRRPEAQFPPTAKPDVTLVAPSPELTEWDFHRRLGALGDYPVLLRRLGIVVRLRVPRPSTAPMSVRVIPRWDGQLLPQRDLAPSTRCTLEDNRFRPEPRADSELKDGTIDLSDATDRAASPSGYRLLVVDTDGAALKLVHTAASLVRHRALRQRGVVRNEVRAEGLAALRTAGIAIVREGRAGALKAQLGIFEAIAPPSQQDAPQELFADDLVRGFHVEVQDATDPEPGPWRSLCKREGTYYVLDDTGNVLDTIVLVDDGYVKRSAATSADGESSPLYVHEALVRWTGWSLVAQRPGRRIKPIPGTRSEDGRVVPTQSEEAVPPIPEPQAELHLATAFHPPADTLPKLRFGRSYRFRLPWVDLAGRAVARSESAPASGKVRYRRFEPLAPPALLPLDEYTPGEALECLVIRSDIGHDATAYVQQVLEPLPDPVTYRATATRHFFPAKVSQLQAEEHGSLDGQPLEWGWRASLRADNTLTVDSLAGLDDPGSVEPFGQPDTVEIPGTIDPLDPLAKEKYAINRHDGTLPTPYLPDPLASGVALRTLPGAAALPAGGEVVVHAVPGVSDFVCHVSFDGDWPELRSFRIRVVERPGTLDPDTGVESFPHADDTPQWDPDARLLTVFLAKSEVAQVAFSTLPDKTRLDWLGTVDWLEADPGSPLERTVELGCHWMVSPSRTLTLVHAVQRPLAPAALASGSADKAPGATVAVVTGRMGVHSESTGNVTLLARWTDEIDDGSSPDLVQVLGTAVLDTFTVPLPLAEGSNADTAFPPVLPPSESASTVAARHELGDPKHRLVRYRLRASTRFREYFPPALAGSTDADGSNGFSRVGGELVVSVPNSVPPEAVSLQYTMPSFGWDVPDPASSTAWTNFERVRSGGGIRVFLDRPWFLSGPSEQLGVVVARPGQELPPTVGSQVGVDPTWSRLSAPTMPVLAASMFKGGDVHESVRLEDGTVVDVVGFDPVLDLERNLWHADVLLDMSALPSTYWPFARLALVRFQPSSIDGAAASKVVLSEFTQLAPDRELKIDVVGTNVTVVVRGRGPQLPSKNVMLIALDEADVADPDELAWRPVAGVGGGPVGDTRLEARLSDAVAGVPDADGFRWQRTVSMPGPRGDRTLRVVVYELELRPTDGEVVADRFAGIPLDNQIVTHLVRNRLLPRVVYADSVRLA